MVGYTFVEEYSSRGATCMNEYMSKLLHRALDSIEAAEGLMNMSKKAWNSANTDK